MNLTKLTLFQRIVKPHDTVAHFLYPNNTDVEQPSLANIPCSRWPSYIGVTAHDSGPWHGSFRATVARIGSEGHGQGRPKGLALRPGPAQGRGPRSGPATEAEDIAQGRLKGGPRSGPATEAEDVSQGRPKGGPRLPERGRRSGPAEGRATADAHPALSRNVSGFRWTSQSRTGLPAKFRNISGGHRNSLL